MINICKIRKFPDWHYFVYYLSKQDRGKWLNVWFQEEDCLYKGKKYSPNNYCTLKEVDKESMFHLYGRRFNPVSIFIINSYKKENPFSMKVMIHSVDDSSYGIWFDFPLEGLECRRLLIMKWISERSIINGEKLLDYCESLGGEDRDYN